MWVKLMTQKVGFEDGPLVSAQGFAAHFAFHLAQLIKHLAFAGGEGGDQRGVVSGERLMHAFQGRRDLLLGHADGGIHPGWD